MYKFHSLGKPAARVGDTHSCPKVTPGTSVPHVGGPVIVAGCLTVFIDGRPAATKGDTCVCVGEPDTITTGSTGVYIEGKPAARMGDSCGHGGVIISGSGTVWIGEKSGNKFFKSADGNEDENFIEPSWDEKSKILSNTIVNCISLLEKKLKLLKDNDHKTLVEFEKWFGKKDEDSKRLIYLRMRRVLKVVRMLSLNNFYKITNENDKKEAFAMIYPDGGSSEIFIGDNFWKTGDQGMDSRGGVLIHELSHLKKVGGTFDFVDGVKNCLHLAMVDPEDALHNADSFEYFIES